MANKEIILIPFWVEKVLTRNKLNLDTVLNFGELSKVLSTNDIAQMLALESYENNVLTLGLSNSYLSRSWYSSAQGSQKTELDFVETVAREGNVINDLITRLSHKGTESGCEPLNNGVVIDNNFFKLVDINKEISAIIVQDNFLCLVRDNSNVLDIIRAVLKNLYIYYSVAEVAAFKVFDKYVKLLSHGAQTLATR